METKVEEQRSEVKAKESYRHGSFYDTDFSKQNLERCDFSGATLHNCNFDNCNLSYTKFVGADCTGSSFRQARLYRTNFKDAKLVKVVMDPRDMFGTTITIHCDTVVGLKASPVWVAGWLQYLLMMDIPEEQKAPIKAAAESVVGAERFKSLQRVFGRREI